MAEAPGVSDDDGRGVSEPDEEGETIANCVPLCMPLGVAVAWVVAPGLTTIRRLTATIATTTIALTAITADLRPVLGGLGIRIISTSRGVISDREARQRKLGGEVLCEVW